MELSDNCSSDESLEYQRDYHDACYEPNPRVSESETLKIKELREKILYEKLLLKGEAHRKEEEARRKEEELSKSLNSALIGLQSMQSLQKTFLRSMEDLPSELKLFSLMDRLQFWVNGVESLGRVVLLHTLDGDSEPVKNDLRYQQVLELLDTIGENNHEIFGTIRQLTIPHELRSKTSSSMTSI